MSTVGRDESAVDIEVAEAEQSPSKSEDGIGEDASELLLRELEEEEGHLKRRNAELRLRLAFYFGRNPAPEEQQVEEEEEPEPGNRDYEDLLERLARLKRLAASQSERAEREERELSPRHREALGQVEEEWRALLSVKRKLALGALRAHLPSEAARHKVDGALESERAGRHRLRNLRLEHAGAESAVARLEAQLAEEEKDPEHVALRAQRDQERRTHRRRSREASRIRKSTERTLELLSNVKEKLHWSRTELRAKGEDLARLRLATSAGMDLLVRTRRARGDSRAHNAELGRSRGLLGNGRLLRDFGATVGASQELERQLEKLKRRREAFVVVRSGRMLSPHAPYENEDQLRETQLLN
ncbi:cilia- and flagella-associated protein 184 [Stigmatopora argus]